MRFFPSNWWLYHVQHDGQLLSNVHDITGETLVADSLVYPFDSLRTAASVHTAKWSPDGEYFATIGKVKDSC